MKEIFIDLEIQDLQKIHDVANELGITFDEALQVMVTNYLEANKQTNKLAKTCNKIGELFHDLADQLQGTGSEPCFFRKEDTTKES